MSIVLNTDIAFKLHNFGADKIYVISEKDSYRREQFIKAWEWSDLEYEFIDAIMAKDLDLDEMILNGELKPYVDPVTNVTRGLIAISKSHLKAYEHALNNSYTFNGGDKIMFMEDDARPNQILLNEISSGEYYKLIKDLSKVYFDIFWVGKGFKGTHIHGEPVTERLQRPKAFAQLGAHAYILNIHRLQPLIDLGKQYTIQADIFLDLYQEVLKISYGPYHSLIQQQGTIWDKFHGDDSLPDDHPINLMKSSSQKNPKEYDNTKDLFDSPHSHLIEKSLVPYIKEIKDVDYQDFFENPRGILDEVPNDMKMFIWQVPNKEQLI